MSATLEPFVNQWAILLTTYRRDGTPVGTAVNIAVEEDRAFIRTWDTVGKAKRMRGNPEVEISPSTTRGRPTASRLTPVGLSPASTRSRTAFSSRWPTACEATKRPTSS